MFFFPWKLFFSFTERLMIRSPIFYSTPFLPQTHLHIFLRLPFTSLTYFIIIASSITVFFPHFFPIIFPVSCALKIFVGFTYLLWDKYSDLGDRASADFFVTRQSKIHGCGDKSQGVKVHLLFQN